MTNFIDNTIPSKKITITGAGIISYTIVTLLALNSEEKIRFSLHDKTSSIKKTTASNLFPSLTFNEALAVVPDPQLLEELMQINFMSGEGIKVPDLSDINDAKTTKNFIEAVRAASSNIKLLSDKQEALLEVGILAMRMWDKLYNHSPILKKIFDDANYHPCIERDANVKRAVGQGYRVDLIYGLQDAAEKASSMKNLYLKYGFKDSDILSPQEILEIDPHTEHFVNTNSENGVWKNTAAAVWRPGGCFNGEKLISGLHKFLDKACGTYLTENGIEKPCFQVHYEHEIDGIKVQNNTLHALHIKNRGWKENKRHYRQNDYFFCPGENVTTLKNLGLKTTPIVRFAGASVSLNIKIPENWHTKYKNLDQYRELHSEGTVVAFQAKYSATHILIGAAGTKAFYGDKQPENFHLFAIHRQLFLLNTINEVLPELVSLAIGKDTTNQKLSILDLRKLEQMHIAKCWVGSRACTFDGMPIIGKAYNENGLIKNAVINTAHGSGGVSIAPAVAYISSNLDNSPSPLVHKIKLYCAPLRSASSAKL